MSALHVPPPPPKVQSRAPYLLVSDRVVGRERGSPEDPTADPEDPTADTHRAAITNKNDSQLKLNKSSSNSLNAAMIVYHDGEYNNNKNCPTKSRKRHLRQYKLSSDVPSSRVTTGPTQALDMEPFPSSPHETFASAPTSPLPQRTRRRSHAGAASATSPPSSGFLRRPPPRSIPR